MITKKIKILHLEDLPSDAELIERVLLKSNLHFEKLVVDNKIDFENALTQFLPNIILSDHSLPSFDSIQALAIVKATGVNIPFILVTATISEEFAVEVMKLGANDYILKDRMQRLPVAILNALDKNDIDKDKQKFIDLVFTNEKKFRHTLDNMLEGMQIIDFDWKYIYVNEALVKQGNYLREELLGYTMMEKYPGIEKTTLFKNMQQCMNERINIHFENEFEFPDGTKTYFELSIQAIAEGISILSIDISEQKKTNAKLLKSNRLYSFISQINQSIVYIKEEEKLISNSCRIALEFGEFKIAFIDFFDFTNKKTKLASSNGIPEHEKYLFDQISYQNDIPQAYVLRNNTYFLCNDVQNALALQNWKTFSIKHGLNSCMVLPIRKQDKVVGTFNLYATESHFFDKEEIALLVEVTSDISFALDIFENIKKQKATDNLLINRERRFSALVENSADMIMLSTTSGKTLYASSSIFKQIGYNLQEMFEISLFELIHPDNITEFRNKRNKILNIKGQSFQSEFRMKHKNGDWIWCEGTISNMLQEPGINAVLFNFRVIAERKLLEQQKEFDKNNFDALINNTNDLMWSVDREFKLITCNKPFEVICKTNLGKVINKGDDMLSNTLSSEMQNYYKHQYERAFKGEAFIEVAHFEFPDEYWEEVSYSPIKDGGEVIGAACHSRDITNLKKAEQQILSNEKRFRALVENSTDMKTLSNGEGILIYGSPSITRILGYTLEEFVGKPSAGFIHPDHIPNLIQNRAVIANNPGSSFHFQYLFLHKNGNYIWCEGTLTNLLQDVDLQAIVANFNDISERKIQEEQKNFDTNNLDALINNTNDLMWSVDRDFKLITANTPFDEMAKINFGKVINKGDYILPNSFTPDMLNHFKSQYERAFTGESYTQLEHFEIPFEFWTEISYYPIRKDDEVIGTACHSRDITNVKKAELQIISNEKRFRALVESGADAVAILTPDGKPFYISPTIEKVLGYTESETLQLELFSLFHAADIAWAIETWEQILNSPGIPIPVKPSRMKHKDGSWRWMEGTLTNLLHEPAVNGIVDNFRDVTDKVNYENQLIKSEAFISGVLNSLNSHIAVVDASGTIVAVNDTWNQFALLNGETDLLSCGIGSNYYKVCEKSSANGISTAQEVLNGMKEIMNGERTEFYIEYPCHSPFSKRWFGLRIIKFKNEEPMIVVAHQNITDRRLAEESLQINQFAIDNAGDAVFWMTPEGKIVNVNEAACSMLNYSKKELLNLSIPDIDIEIDAEKWQLHFAELKQKGSLFFETVQKTKEGKLVPVEIRANYIKYNDVELNCAFSRDISERKKAKEILIKSEARLNEAQAVGKIGNWEIDLTTFAHNWSDELYHILGINLKEENTSLDLFFDLVHPNDIRFVRKTIKHSMDNLVESAFNFRFITKDKTQKFGYIEHKFEFDENNKPIRLYGILQDITESKLAELERIKITNDLIQRNKDLEQFSYIISHNLRLPVANIMGITNIINTFKLDADEQHEMYINLTTSVKKLDEVIKDLNYILDVKQDVSEKREKVQFLELINDIKVSINSLLNKEDAVFITDFSSVESMLTLKSYLHSIFYNLILNSIKYRQSAIKPIISISSKKIGNTIQLCFKDNGLGINLEKNRDKVFGLYKRFHTHTEGKGMGLYMVKVQVEALGGKINIISELNVGTQFIIEFEDI